MPLTRAGAARDDASTIARLAVPLLVNNLALGGMLSADTIMAGRLGADQLAAVAIGSNFAGVFHFFALGMLMALSPLVAHAYGAGRDRDIGAYVRQGLWLAAGVGLLIVTALTATEPLLRLIGIPAATAELASRYVRALSLGMPALCGFYALRFGSEGIGWTRPFMYTAVIGLVVNIVLNYVLMYGKFGFPALGAVGTGYATAITWWLLFAILWCYVKRHRVYSAYAPLGRRELPQPARLREIVVLGSPIAGSLVLEGGMFNAAALLLATFGATVMAAHAIAINYAALMFMIPMSLNSATTIHVGHQLGRSDAPAAARAAWTGVGMGVVVMGLSALVMIVARNWIAGLYTRDGDVLLLAANLLLFAAVFQIADGVQVCTAGALRGYKDTRMPLVYNLFAYWGIGFPLAWYLGFQRGWSAQGVWMGLIAGLFVAAALLSLRLWRVARVRDDRSPASRSP